MTWFFIALLNPLLHAATNHIDKYLIVKYFKNDRDGEVGALILFSCLFAVFVLPILFLLEPAVFSIPLSSIIMLMANGVILALAIILYLYAIERDEASIVVPFFQVVPIFAYILGVFFLDEIMSKPQLAAGALILSAAVALSLDLEGEKVTLKKGVATLMLLSSFCYAVSGILFKFVAIDENAIVSIFWDFAGLLLAGILIFILIPRYRKEFIFVATSSRKVFTINSINEILGLIGEAAFKFAFLLAPVTMVFIVGAFQPLFVFVIGVILTLFFPRLATEKISRKHLVQKISAIAVMLVGTYLFYLN